MYLNGMGFRGIERVTGVHHTTIINWVKQIGKLLPDAYNPEVIPRVGELDELQTFVGSKKTKYDAAAIAASDARRVFELRSCDSSRSLQTMHSRMGFRQSQLIVQLQEKAQEAYGDTHSLTTVFNGKEQPNLVDNLQFQSVLTEADWFSPQEWQAHARKSLVEGGLELSSWLAAERPFIVWLGQEFNVRGQAYGLLRRSFSENMCIVGSNNSARYGILSAIAICLSVNLCPNELEFSIYRSQYGGN